jgi:hypothetical protein
MLPDGQPGLFLSPIPEPPGDPAALAAAARTYTAGQSEIDRNHAALTATAAQVGGPAWQGQGGTAYQKVSSDLAAVYALTSRGLAQGAVTLRSYAASLAAAKEAARQANAAVAQSNAAATALLDAQAAAEQAQAAADNTAQAATDSEATAAANPHSVSAKVAAENARSAADDAQSAASGAADRVSALSGQYDADHARALSLIAEAQAQATRAASSAAAGFDAAASELMGDRPHAARGGAHGQGGSSAWLRLGRDVAGWDDYAGFALAGWGAYGGFAFGKASLNFFNALRQLGSAQDEYDTAFANFYGKLITERSVGYFDMKQKKTALDDAKAAEEDSEGDLLESIDGAGALKLVGQVGMGLAIVSDGIEFVRPDHVFGNVGAQIDRWGAVANAAASGLALGSSLEIGAAATLMAIPGVDVAVGVVLVGTTLYATSELVWKHFGGNIKHAVHDVGHFFDDVGNDIASIF